MKKTVYIALLSASCLITNSVLANNDYYDYERNFSGWLVGAETNVSKYDLKHYSNMNSKSGMGLSVIGAYGFEFGDSNFIGQLQERIGFGTSSIKDNDNGGRLKEKFSTGFSYLQGYRFANTLMPYVKLSYDFVYFDTDQISWLEGHGAHGVGLGGGLKYTVTDDIEFGVEYTRQNIKGSRDVKLKGDNVAVNLSYRF